MQSEFRGDFTRNTYDKSKNFLRVLMQQGRVQLDADCNEQVSILLDRMQALGKDIIGFHGGPADNCGFEFIATEAQIERLSSLSDEEKITLKKRLHSEGCLIGSGNYYVEGILCENDDYISFGKQPDFSSEVKVEDGTYLAYLDVWERHITHIEDFDSLKAGIREVALGGADTATRSKLVWQVKLKKLDGDQDLKTIGQQVKSDYKSFQSLLGKDLKPGTGKLRARATKPLTSSSNDSCIMPFDSQYRGAENQLYRVEIFDVSSTENNQKVKFAWSRDNSSVAFPIVGFSRSNDSTLTLTLEYLKRDDRFSLSVGDWVEFVYDDRVLHEFPRKLLEVDKIDLIDHQVTLKLDADFQETHILLHNCNAVTQEQHPLLRLWDSREISVDLDNKKEKWIQLENGVEVQFEGGSYQVNDYWLIPTRTATGKVEWPQTKDGTQLIPEAKEPHGVDHYYAPLAIISVAQNQVVKIHDCRRSIGNQKNSVSGRQKFNRVVNASWHHDQIFEVNNLEEQGEKGSTLPDQIFAGKSQDLTNLLTKLGLVIEFEKLVRVDSLHQRSVLLSAQQINPSGGRQSYLLPIKIEPVRVKKSEVKPISWLIGNQEVESEFNLITEVESLNNQNFTQAVRLILPKDWSTKAIFTKNTFFELKVLLKGDLIQTEEVLFDISSANLTQEHNNGNVSDSLHQHFLEKGILLSSKARLFQEKDNLRWRLIDEENMYLVRQENSKLTISTIQALDGNNIWPSVPERPSGNGSQGGDWLSVINIKHQGQAFESEGRLKSRSLQSRSSIASPLQVDNVANADEDASSNLSVGEARPQQRINLWENVGLLIPLIH